MTDEEKSIIIGFLAGLKPEPRLLVSEWADKYRYLSPIGSAEPGRWRTERTPYLREIMDKLSAGDPTEEIVFEKGSQVGATELGFNWLGYIIDIAPAPTLLVQPTDEMCRRNSKIRFDPMIEATPRLREKIKPARSRDSGNTTLQKEFAGGVAILTGANSAVGLRSMPVRNLFLDEVDGYPEDLDGEGSPIQLAMARTRTFARRKVFKCSTPTIEGRSAIEREFCLTDQRYYYVPCPHCGIYQQLKWECLKWIEGKPETVKYYCDSCDQPIEERYKTQMLAAGTWTATVPENANPKRVGYHLSALYSPLGWYSWEKAAQDYEDAQTDSNKMKTFTNTVLGETQKQKGEAPPWENIYNRRERYQTNIIPLEVAFLTAGTDIQKDRIEVEIVGWCKGKISYSIDYRVLEGDTSAMEVWNKLALLLSEQWVREDKVSIPIRLMAVDTGYNTTHAYNFCRRFDRTRVIPVKGQDKLPILASPPKPIEYTSGGKKIAKIFLYNIGVSIIKSELYGWLRQEKDEAGIAPPGFCHFPEYDPHYFKGITAEQLEFHMDHGYRKYQWVKKYERNEPLDCRVYARAAAAVIGMDRFTDAMWEAMKNHYSIKTPVAIKKRQSTFWT